MKGPKRLIHGEGSKEVGHHDQETHNKKKRPDSLQANPGATETNVDNDAASEHSLSPKRAGVESAIVDQEEESMASPAKKLTVPEKAIERGLGPLYVIKRIEIVVDQLDQIREKGLSFDESLYGQKLPEGMSQSLDELLSIMNRLPILAEMLRQIKAEMRIDYDTGVVRHDSWNAESFA